MTLTKWALTAAVAASPVGTSTTSSAPAIVDPECAQALDLALRGRELARAERDEWRVYAEGLEAVASAPIVEQRGLAWGWVVVIAIAATAGGAAAGAAASQ